MTPLDAADNLTVLTSVNRARASKTFSLGKDGKIKNRSFANEKFFAVASVEVSSLGELAAALERISRNPYALIVRGEPLPGIDRKRARRLLHPDKKTGEPATLAEVPRRWFLVDVDEMPCPAAIDPKSDPEGAVEYVIGLLPPELWDASCWWQFSSQQSVYPDKQTIRLHLWFWSETPLGDAELKRWAITVNSAAGHKLVDPSLFQAVQAHYVAVPDFVAPLADPLPQRCGLRQGLEETVSLIIPPPHPKRPAEPGTAGYTPGRGVAAYLAMIGGVNGFREPIVKAIASFVGSHGSAADCTELKNEIRQAIDRADPGGRSDDDLDRYKSDAHVDDIIAAIHGFQGDTPGRGFTPEPPPEFDNPPPHPGESDGPTPDPEEAPGIDPLPVEFSEDALTLQFSAEHGDDWRFVALWGKWMQWLGTHWRGEETLHAFELARRICRRNSALVDKPGLARAVASARTVAAVEKLARADRRHAMRFEQFDANDWMLSQSQTLDLKTGRTYPPRREDYNTKITAVAADARVPTPLWTAFLDRITAGNKELQAYLQRVAGYCMTGVTVEHVLFFLYGTGANGKGVFLNTLRGIWADYAVVASMETFIETRYPQHSADLAMLVGARLVIAQEVERNKAWAEAKINSLTGGDPVTAHYMRQNYFEYTPKFKLVIAGNHKPSLRSVNEAVRRRFHLVPFTVTIPEEERDTELGEKLKAEWPGILAWALQGCLKWQKIGLAPPPVVREASEAYFAEQDLIRSWIDECCCDIDNKAASESSSALYKSWAAWAVGAGEDPGSSKAFSSTLEECGFRRKHDRNGTRFYGIALNPSEMSDEEAERRYWQK